MIMRNYEDNEDGYNFTMQQIQVLMRTGIGEKFFCMSPGQ